MEPLHCAWMNCTAYRPIPPTMSAMKLMRAVGEQIRAKRIDLNLTQRELGTRAGIVDKYVSEIERGTRDIPISTLYAIVEQGLELRLEVVFRTRSEQERSRIHNRLEEVWLHLSTLSSDAQVKVADILRAILGLMR